MTPQVGVTTHVQTLFEDIDDHFSCRWEGTNIICEDYAKLSAPNYDEVIFRKSKDIWSDACCI